MLFRSGEPRIVSLFERWLQYSLDLRSGCVFAAAAFELDDQPGPSRAALVRAQRDWLETLAQAARIAQKEGHFRAELDPDRFALALYGIMLSTHVAIRLLGDPRGREHARANFDDLVAAARAAR